MTPLDIARRLAFALVAAAALVTLTFAAYWRLTGGTWFIVQTASMGTAAPVGTFLLDREVPFAELKVGDFITFHPPLSPNQIFSHRVSEISPNGTLLTRGDNEDHNDPWRIRPSDVIGRVVHAWWPLGWIVRMLPLILISGAITVMLVRYATKPDLRVPAAVMGGTLVIILAIHVYHPLTQVQLIASSASGDGVHATFVSTGLWNARVAMKGAETIELAPGQLGRMTTTKAGTDGHFEAEFKPVVPWWAWLFVVALGVGPGLATSIAQSRDDEERAETDDAEPSVTD
ncbi:MAG: S26 family signal peptidase [Nocardiaceae bacterium]|nr:S26 family signal peptidase [Nocardiaceae bacterium]